VMLRNLSITGGNSGDYVAGAIQVLTDATQLILENTTVHGNSGAGGTTIYGGSLMLLNSTVSGNVSSQSLSSEYGAVQGRRVELINSTISNSTRHGVGAFSGGVLLKNSII